MIRHSAKAMTNAFSIATIEGNSDKSVELY